MSRITKFPVGIVLVWAMLLAVAGIAGAKTVLHMYTHSYEPWNNALQELINRYEKLNADVEIKYTILPDFETKLPLLFQTREPVDIINIHDRYLAKYLPFMSEAPPEVVKDIRENAPEAARISEINGKLYGYTYPDVHAVFVNKNSYKEAGIAYPEYWHDLPQIDQKLTKVAADGKIERYGVNLFFSHPLFLVAYYNNVLEAYGGTLLNQQGLAGFNTPEGLRALNDFKAASHPDIGMWDSFAMGTNATMVNCRWVATWIQGNAKADLEWEVIPPPKGENGVRIGQGYFQLMGVPNYRPEKQRQEAWKFLQFVYGEEGNLYLEQASGSGTWRLDTMDALKEKDPAKAVFFESAKYASKPIIHTKYAEMERIVGEAMQKFILGTSSAEKAWADAEKELNKILK